MSLCDGSHLDGASVLGAAPVVHPAHLERLLAIHQQPLPSAGVGVGVQLWLQKDARPSSCTPRCRTCPFIQWSKYSLVDNTGPHSSAPSVRETSPVRRTPVAQDCLSRTQHGDRKKCLGASEACGNWLEPGTGFTTTSPEAPDVDGQRLRIEHAAASSCSHWPPACDANSARTSKYKNPAPKWSRWS